MSTFTDDDALAAEFMLGTLPADEHEAAAARQAREPAFAALVREWEAQLSPLAETIPAVEPDARLQGSILASIDRLGGTVATADGPGTGPTVVALRRQVTRWRYATVLCGSLAALLAIWLATARFVLPPKSGDTYVAVLQQGAGAPAFLVSLDLANRRMMVMPADAPAEANKSYELWMIGSDAAAPRSLGLVDAPKLMRASLPAVSADQISHATYAITVEPKGGSPTGKPTSAPVFTGHLIPMHDTGST